MKVTREKTENSQAYLTIEMEPADLEHSMEAAYRHLVNRARIPGFRKGKAPRAILERYLGKESLVEEAINHFVPEAYEKAVKEQNIEPMAQPQIEITQKEPLIFKAVVPLPPTVDPGDYHKIEVKPVPADVKEDDINNVIEGLRHQHATWEPVDRVVDFNDLLTLDVESTVEGKPFLNQNGAQYQVLRDLASPVPGFAEQLPGVKKGETKEFTLKFPVDYPREGFAGKEASFKVKIVEIKQEKLPEVTDELAKQINAELATVDALKERVTANLKIRAEESAKIEFEESTVDAVVEKAKVEFPPILVDVEIDRLINDQTRRLQLDARGLEQYLKGINKTGEQLRDDLRPLAQKRVTRSLVLDKIAEAEKVEVPDADINAEIENILTSAKESDRDDLRKFLDTPHSRESIKLLLLRRKTIAQLVEIAKAAAPAPQQETKEEKPEAKKTEKSEEKKAEKPEKKEKNKTKEEEKK